MEGMASSSSEMEIPKTETCEVFEAGVCAMPCNDGSSEIFSLENGPQSMEDSAQNHQTASEAIASDGNNALPSEISPNLSVEQNLNPEPVKPSVEPVNMENPNFTDFNQMQVQKPNSTSNKRKSDNHAESNIEEKKNYNMRKNLRGVIDENNFDTITKAAQQEEAERLARVQGLKKSVKHKFSHPSLEAMLEDLPFEGELQSTKSMISYERQDTQLQSKTMNLEAKDIKCQRIEDKKIDKKVWNEWMDTEQTNVPLEDNGEVVTIDSSSSDEDDCIILSDSDDCMEDEEDDDHHNSGLHVSDTLNIPNEHGKVLVNVGHVESEPDIFVAPQIAKIIKPHQIGGVRFLFDNIIESTKRFNNSSGFGCILAHSMGLGKTLQVVCFCDIFLRHTEAKTILCVMPINTIQNWLREFNMWLPKESHNPEVVRPRHFNVFALDDQHKTLSSRSNIILRWAAEGGVLLIGYELFRVLGMKIVKKREGKRQESAEHKRMLDRVHMALVKPGPDLVICDEGHRIKNAHAGISVALKQIRSRRRIVLTGYPLQNNLLEYWCMVDFVRPNYLGTKTEFCNMFERPIQNGQCIDSTPEDIKLMRYRAHVLHSLLVGFVQRRSDSVLQNSLPQKLEYVILTKMTKFQRDLYDAFMNEVVRKKKVPNPLKAFAVCCKIWNHPDVLYRFLKKKESDFDLDIEEQSTPQEAPTKALVDNSKLSKTNSECPTFLSEESPQKEFVHSLDNSLSSEPFYTNTAESKCFYPNSMMVTPTKENPPTFWQDGVSTVEAQQPKPDYVGLMAKPGSDSSSEEQLKCPSQIVDLDTKEVQFVKSDISTELDVGSVPGNAKQITTDAPSSSTIPKIIKPEPKGGNDTITYDWALNLIKTYEPGLVKSSPKMEVLLCILEESVKMGDRVLVFSQSLLTLNLIEFFLQNNQVPDSQSNWKKNVSYFRLDGSTTSMEREKLVIEFNSNTDVKLFLISTRAGSLGINLTGANRVVVFDASWNPCHDTQAVHRIYRYGQKKSCFVYRVVMDNCLEKNIYDRQVKKQGMSDRVVDECNPDAHLSIRELTNLCYDKEEENQSTEFKEPLENYSDTVIRKVITDYKNVLSKEPFYHESLLIDRKDKKLSQSEKRMAKRGYEIEKKASTRPTFLPNNIVIQNRDCIQNHIMPQPIRKKFIKEPIKNPGIKCTRWIPAEVWQRQGMSSQEMMLPIDVAIPTNSTETSNIVVKAGEKVMVLKSPKGVYMQLESGKIIAIKTSAEAAADRLKAKKLNCVEMPSKKPFNMLNTLAFKNDHGRASVDRAIVDDKDDVIVISDSINDDAEPTFDLTSPSKPQNRNEITNTKSDIVIPQVFPNRKDVIPNELRNDKQETVTLKPQSHTQPQPQPQSLPQTLPQAQPSQQPQPQAQPQPQPQRQHQHQHTHPHPNQHQHQHQHQNQQQQQHQHHNQHQPQPQESQYEQQNMYEHPHRSGYPDKHQHRNNFYNNMTSNSTYETYPQHNMKGLHLQPHPTPPQRWENKSPDVFKQPPLKISNIPAPYPSTAISDMNAFEKNEKAQQPPVNDIINVDQYAPASSSYTPQTCKESEEHSFHHPLNHPTSTNYYNTAMPTTSTDDAASYNSLYHFNNKHEANYSENLYDNTESPHSNYHPSYGYYPPQYLPNFSNKVYDNNAYSSQYYIRRPPPFSTNSTNGVDLGYNFTEPQGWIKKHLPD